MALNRLDVINMLSGKGERSTAELEGWGISRQYISLLKRAGVLTRVRHGRYRLAVRHQSREGGESDSH